MRIFKETLPTRYSLKRHISSGAYGDVIAVRDKVRKLDLALKILKGFDKKKARTLAAEFSTLSSLDHPNLIKVYDYGFLQSGIPYFTMEIIYGQDLRSFFRAKANLKHLPNIISQSLSALKYIHSKQILHGDLKPENIMITNDKQVKLLDFGLVVKSGVKKKISGTPGYLSLEVLKEGRYSESSDLYAIGISLLESITQTKPPKAAEKNEYYTKIQYMKLNKILSDAGIVNHASLSSFILNLCSSDREIRPLGHI